MPSLDLRAHRISNGGLIVTASALAVVHRELIIPLAAKHKLPAVYFQHQFVTEGGLASHGSEPVEQYRRAAAYVDRILQGDTPVDLPVQAQTTYQLAIDLRTAKALGIAVSPTLLARADEVIKNQTHATRLAEAYAIALFGEAVRAKKDDPAGSIGALVASYMRSAGFVNLRGTSKKGYMTRLETIRIEHGQRSVSGLARERIIKMLQPYADPPARRLIRSRIFAS